MIVAAERAHRDGPRPAAFLDRDGVVNVDTGYPHRPEELILTPTAAQAIRALNEAGWWTIVVTNQSGVARGLFDMADVDRFHAAIRERLAQAGARIDAFYVAPYHPDGTVPRYAIDHPDRKPGPGMLLRAMAEWPVLLERSVMIGDRDSDREAAERAGIAGVIVPSDECDLAAVVADLIARDAKAA